MTVDTDDDDVEGDDVAPVTQNPIPSKSRTSTRSQLPPDKPVKVAKASSTRKTTAQSNPKGKSKAPGSNPATLSSDEDEPLAPIRKAGPSTTQSSNKDRSDNQRSAGTKNQKPKDVLNPDQESSDSDTPLALAVADKPRSTSRSTTKKTPPRPISNMPDTVEGSSKPSKRVRQDRKNVTEEHGQSEPSGRGGKKRAETTVDVPSGVNDADDRDVEQVESAPKKVARKGKDISSRSKDKTKAEKKPYVATLLRRHPEKNLKCLTLDLIHLLGPIRKIATRRSQCRKVEFRCPRLASVSQFLPLSPANTSLSPDCQCFLCRIWSQMMRMILLI